MQGVANAPRAITSDVIDALRMFPRPFLRCKYAHNEMRIEARAGVFIQVENARYEREAGRVPLVKNNGEGLSRSQVGREFPYFTFALRYVVGNQASFRELCGDRSKYPLQVQIVLGCALAFICGRARVGIEMRHIGSRHIARRHLLHGRARGDCGRAAGT